MRISFPFVYQTFAKTVKKVKEFIKPLSVSKKMEQDFEDKERNPVSQNKQGNLYLFLVFFSVGYTVRQLVELIVERKTWAFEKFFPVGTSPYWH